MSLISPSSSATSSPFSSSSSSSTDAILAESAFKMLTGALSKFRDQLSETLLCTPQGYASLDALVHDFRKDFGFCPDKHIRKFGYSSLGHFLHSDYMKKRVRFAPWYNNGGELIFGVPDEHTLGIYNAIMKCYFAKLEDEKKKEAAKKASNANANRHRRRAQMWKK